MLRSPQRQHMRLTARSIVLAACTLVLVAVPQARSGTTEVRLDWDGVRTIVDHVAPRPNVRERTVANPGQVIRARLTAVTETGLALSKGRNEISVLSEDVLSIRIFPARTRNRRNRRIAAIFAVPIGIGTFVGTTLLTALTTGGIPEGGYGHGPSIGFLAAGVAVPYLVYKKARSADRGSILIILDQGKEKGK